MAFYFCLVKGTIIIVKKKTISSYNENWYESFIRFLLVRHLFLFSFLLLPRLLKAIESSCGGQVEVRMGEDRLTFSLGGTVHCTVSAKPLCQRKDRVTTEKKLFYSLPTDQCYV